MTSGEVRLNLLRGTSHPRSSAHFRPLDAYVMIDRIENTLRLPCFAELHGARWWAVALQSSLQAREYNQFYDHER